MLFGTDGIRGTVNSYPMTPDIALKLGMAAGVYFGKRDNLGGVSSVSNQKTSSHERQRTVIAKDTRLSGYLVEPAITSGLISVGVDVILVGPMPTPALSMLVKSLRADFGLMITASHNPYYDNGIKIFDRNGFKLSNECEIAIQDLMLSFSNAICGNKSSYDCLHGVLVTPDRLGRASRLDDAPGRYIEYVKNTFPKFLSLRGIRIVLDCANGAAYKVAPSIFSELDADVIAMNCEPNGLNINSNCGSTYPHGLCTKVVAVGADIGIALDGDSDRLLICDETGNVVHGDVIIGLIAMSLHDAGSLTGGGIVVTNLSNMALDAYLNEHGVEVWRTGVGDRHVASEMRRRGCNFGGEQSGHILCANHSTSSDAIVAALQILAICISSSQKVSELCQLFQAYPQLQANIGCGDDNPLDKDSVKTKLNELQSTNHHLRFMVRKSGTENKIRIMVEGRDAKEVEMMLREIEEIVTNCGT